MDAIETPDWVKNQVPGQTKYPWRTVEVGKSFFVEHDRQTCTFESFKVMAINRGRELGRKFHVRVVPEGEEHAGAFQCWRAR